MVVNKRRADRHRRAADGDGSTSRSPPRRAASRSRNGANLAGRRGFDWLDDAALQKVAQQAVERTMVLFDARRPPAGRDAGGAGGRRERHPARTRRSATAWRRTSTARARASTSTMIGKQIAPEFVTIVDDAHARQRARRAQRRRRGQRHRAHAVLVENGVLAATCTIRSAPEHYKLKPARARAGASRTGTRRCRACAARTWRTGRTRARRSSPR